MTAVWIPVTVVPRSLATVAIAVFMTVVSRAMTNWPAASVSSTSWEPDARDCAGALAAVLIVPDLPASTRRRSIPLAGGDIRVALCHSEKGR